MASRSTKRCECCGGFTSGTYMDDKGCIRISSGKHRGKRVHTLVAEAKIGRKLRADEQVHHIDGDKQNPEASNLQVLGRREHGAVSHKQAWFFKEHEVRDKAAWDSFHEASA